MRTTVRFQSRTRPGAWKVVAGFLLAGCALLAGLQLYLRTELPRLHEALARAESEAGAMLAAVPEPPGAVPYGPEEKKPMFGGTRSLWQGVSIGMTWVRRYDFPGQWSELRETFASPLEKAGWMRDRRRQRELSREFVRGKWRLTISSHESFGYPPVARVVVELSWGYLR